MISKLWLYIFNFRFEIRPNKGHTHDICIKYFFGWFVFHYYVTLMSELQHFVNLEFLLYETTVFLCWSHWITHVKIQVKHEESDASPWKNVPKKSTGSCGTEPSFSVRQSLHTKHEHLKVLKYIDINHIWVAPIWGICLIWFICSIGLKQTALRGGASQDIRRFATWCIFENTIYAVCTLKHAHSENCGICMILGGLIYRIDAVSMCHETPCNR